MATSIQHCGNRLAIQTVFRRIFITPNTITCKRNFSNVVSPPMKVIDYNRLIKQQAKWFKKTNASQLEAIELLNDMKQKGIEPNSNTYLQLVMGMCLQRHRTNAQNARLEDWIDQLLILQKDKDPATALDRIQKVIQHLSLKGHPRLKLIFLRIVNDFQNVPLDIEYWNMAIKGCIMAREVKDAEAILGLAREMNMANSESYQLLIDAYLYYNDKSSASGIFSSMLQDKVTAKYPVYELFIKYYMQLPTSTDTFETCHRLWQAVLMTIEKEIPDELIYSYLHYFGEHGKLDKAEQIYLDTKSRNQRLNRKCLGEMHKVMIGFAYKQQLLSAISLYYDLLGQGYKPSLSVLTKIVTACKEEKDPEAIEQLVETTLELNPDAEIAHLIEK